MKLSYGDSVISLHSLRNTSEKHATVGVSENIKQSSFYKIFLYYFKNIEVLNTCFSELIHNVI